MQKVLDNGLKPILCIGESKEEYEAGLNKEVGLTSRKCIPALLRRSSSPAGLHVSVVLASMGRQPGGTVVYRPPALLEGFQSVLVGFRSDPCGTWACLVYVSLCRCYVLVRMVSTTSHTRPCKTAPCLLLALPFLRSAPSRWGRVCPACPLSRWKTWLSRTSR